MKITHFQRSKTEYFSLEKVFILLRDQLSFKYKFSVFYMPKKKITILSLFNNIIYSILRSDKLNHVCGDIHYLCCFLPKSNIILSVFDCVSYYKFNGLKKHFFVLFWYLIPLRRARIIIVVSNSVKRELIDVFNCDPTKLHVIYCPLSPYFKKNIKDFNKINPNILLIGTSHNKNLNNTIPALKNISCNVNIIGRMNQEIDDLFKINQINYRNYFNLLDEEVLKLYFNADIILFASTYEGFGLPIVEGNAVGRVVITSNLSSMPEIAGNAACLVNPYSQKSIRDGVLLVIHNEIYRNILIERGYENAKRFNLGFIAKQYADIYDLLGVN